MALFTAFATCWVPGGQGIVSETFEACNALTTVCLAVKLLVYVSTQQDCKFFNSETHVLFILSLPTVPHTKPGIDKGLRY